MDMYVCMYVCVENTRCMYVHMESWQAFLYNEGILAVDKFKINFNHFRRRSQLIFIFIYFIKDVRNLLTFISLIRNEYVWGFSPSAKLTTP